MKKQNGRLKNVLVVDDNAALRSHVRTAFEADGFDSCLEAKTGLEAIQIASECDPSVIILDLAMPGMTGIQAAPLLRNLLPDTPIILFTLYADALHHVDLKALGISAAFSKTDSIDDLLKMAHELIKVR